MWRRNMEEIATAAGQWTPTYDVTIISYYCIKSLYYDHTHYDIKNNIQPYIQHS